MNYTFNEGDNITITAEFIDYLENLKKENQQLKEKYNIRSKAYNNILLENASLHNVLDEISEVIIELRNIIYNPDYENFGLSREQYKDRFIHIFEILDKVKE